MFLHHSWFIVPDNIFTYCLVSCILILLHPGPAPGWHLEYIDVKDELLDKTFRFPCDRWLAKNDDDGQIMRELACANNDYLDLNEKTSKDRMFSTLLNRRLIVKIAAVICQPLWLVHFNITQTLIGLCSK